MKILVIIGLVVGFSSLWNGTVMAVEGKQASRTVSADEVKKEAREALATTKAYTAQQSVEFQKRLKAELDRMQSEIDRLAFRLNQMKDESRAEMDKQMKELQAKKDATAKTLRDMESASGKAWEDLRAGMRAAMEDLDKAYNRAVSRFP